MLLAAGGRFASRKMRTGLGPGEAATAARLLSGVQMDHISALLGGGAGLTLGALLVASRDDCARWVLTQIDGSRSWTPPLSGAVTGTGIFFGLASVWVLSHYFIQ